MERKKERLNLVLLAVLHCSKVGILSARRGNCSWSLGWRVCSMVSHAKSNICRMNIRDTITYKSSKN